MSTRSARPDPPADASGDASNQLERELLARLGLSADANSLDIQNAHDELTSFLERAPRDLGPWARRQIDVADEAYALLSDPTKSLARPLSAPVAEQPPRAAIPGRRVGPVGRALIAALAVVAFVTVGYAVYASGAPSVPGLTGTPAPEASGQGQVDAGRVADLMTKIQADPKDVVSLQALGDQYFQAADWATAADWERKVLELDPTNATAMLGLGAAEFNQGNATEAERQWRAVLAIDPKNIEAHYDLGFMYFSQNPPDVAQTTIEWNKVIEIAPDSDVAKTVSTHLKTLETWAASASPADSPETGASPSAVSSPESSGSAAPTSSSVAP